jgi:hypothetical protein
MGSYRVVPHRIMSKALWRMLTTHDDAGWPLHLHGVVAAAR